MPSAFVGRDSDKEGLSLAILTATLIVKCIVASRRILMAPFQQETTLLTGDTLLHSEKRHSDQVATEREHPYADEDGRYAV